MDTLQMLFTNKLFVIPLLAWMVAQILKTIIHFIVTKEFVAERLMGNGGMPSSHSSTVCAMATAVYFEYGVSGYEFPMALLFAIIVMHDAMNVRLETGLQAKLLNDIMDTFKSMGRSEYSSQKMLKEFVGHTPLQVLMGAILGVVLTIGLYRI
ncbi:MAG: divergent PAP2 family protein [Lachnospiraceae bacterium]|nr:divergent PAP2 family protein [Lachnospiraceae bacterium]